LFDIVSLFYGQQLAAQNIMVGERLVCKLAALDNCQPVNNVNFSQPVTCLQ